VQVPKYLQSPLLSLELAMEKLKSYRRSSGSVFYTVTIAVVQLELCKLELSTLFRSCAVEGCSICLFTPKH